MKKIVKMRLRSAAWHRFHQLRPGCRDILVTTTAWQTWVLVCHELFFGLYGCIYLYILHDITIYSVILHIIAYLVGLFTFLKPKSGESGELICFSFFKLWYSNNFQHVSCNSKDNEVWNPLNCGSILICQYKERPKMPWSLGAAILLEIVGCFRTLDFWIYSQCMLIPSVNFKPNVSKCWISIFELDYIVTQ